MVFLSINYIQTIVSNIYHINKSNGYVVDAITFIFYLRTFRRKGIDLHKDSYTCFFFVKDQIEQTLIRQCAIM